MLEHLRASDFEALRGTRFRLLANGPETALEVPLELAVVERLSPESASRVRGEAFSLTFHAALDAPRLRQAIYRLEHDSREPLEIFLVPLGPDKGVFRYEAIFT